MSNLSNEDIKVLISFAKEVEKSASTSCDKCAEKLKMENGNLKYVSIETDDERIKDKKFCSEICAEGFLRRFLPPDEAPYDEETLAYIKNMELHGSMDQFCSMQNGCHKCDLSEFHEGSYDQPCSALYKMAKMIQYFAENK